MPRARKSTTKSTTTGPDRQATGPDAKTRLIQAALDLAARQGWRRTGMAEIAREAGLSLAETYAQFRAKPCVLAGFVRSIDAQVLAGGEPEGSTRDRLFELLMRRFDALRPYRPGLRAIIRDSVGEPTALCGLPLALNSMAWMLEAAGISAEGWRGRARIVALTGTYAAVFRIFLNDESEDLAKTMAALDRRLNIRPFRRNDGATAAQAA